DFAPAPGRSEEVVPGVGGETTLETHANAVDGEVPLAQGDRHRLHVLLAQLDGDGGQDLVTLRGGKLRGFALEEPLEGFLPLGDRLVAALLLEPLLDL